MDITDVEFDSRLRLWAARVLTVDPSEIESVETDWWGLCDTCEFSRGEIDVHLVDGRHFRGENEFGLFLRDIVELDLKEDGTLESYAYNRELFELKEVV